MLRAVLVAFALLAHAVMFEAAASPDAERRSPWFDVDAEGAVAVDLHFFWSTNCPHCHRARAFLDELASERPWLRVHAREITRSPENARRFAEMAKATGHQARYVPAVFVCGAMVVGFDAAETTGASIRDLAAACRQYASERHAGQRNERAPLARDATAEIPLLGTVALETSSLPVLTVVLAGLDAFNPCAFFVLLFLLSVLVHARSRPRMAIVGGVFVLVSGLAYFAFMAAWLSLFMLVGHLAAVTITAGLVALAVGALNVKDFFAPGAGVSLSIPQWAKPRLFARMQGLMSAERLPAMLLGTVALAIAANSYELLCTAGFPMVYTRALTLQELAPAAHYLYLAAYVTIYVIPLALIVVAFTLTLGARKLTERQGRLLKLASGTMMLGLGSMLLIAPERMTTVAVPAGLIAVALAVVVAASWAQRHRKGGIP